MSECNEAMIGNLNTVISLLPSTHADTRYIDKCLQRSGDVRVDRILRPHSFSSVADGHVARNFIRARIRRIAVRRDREIGSLRRCSRIRRSAIPASSQTAFRSSRPVARRLGLRRLRAHAIGASGQIRCISALPPFQRRRLMHAACIPSVGTRPKREFAGGTSARKVTVRNHAAELRSGAAQRHALERAADVLALGHGRCLFPAAAPR